MSAILLLTCGLCDYLFQAPSWTIGFLLGLLRAGHRQLDCLHGLLVQRDVLPKAIKDAVEKSDFFLFADQVREQDRVKIPSTSDVNELKRAAGIDHLTQAHPESQVFKNPAKGQQVSQDPLAPHARKAFDRADYVLI